MKDELVLRNPAEPRWVAYSRGTAGYISFVIDSDTIPGITLAPFLGGLIFSPLLFGADLDLVPWLLIGVVSGLIIPVLLLVTFVVAALLVWRGERKYPPLTFTSEGHLKAYHTFQALPADEKADAAAAYHAYSTSPPGTQEDTDARWVWEDTLKAIEERKMLVKKQIGSPTLEAAQKQLEDLREVNRMISGEPESQPKPAPARKSKSLITGLVKDWI